MPIHGEFKTIIDASPERVWRWVGDISTHAQWSPKPYEVKLLSGEPNTVGSRYESVGSVPGNKHNRNEFEITRADAGQCLEFRADDPLGAFQNRYTLNTLGTATEVTYSITFPTLKGMPAIMAPIAFPLVGKADIRKRLQLLKGKVESSK